MRDDPADYRVKDEPDGNPYEMQYHLFSKNQPENLAWLERIRALLDEYDDRASVGEMGESASRHPHDGRIHRAGPAASVLQLRDDGL